MDGESNELPRQGPPAILRRRFLAHSAGVAAVAALASGGDGSGAGNVNERLIEYQPKGKLVLIGGATAPLTNLHTLEEMQEIAKSLQIPFDKLKSPKLASDTLSADELQKMAEACDPTGIFREVSIRSPLKGKTVIYVACAKKETDQTILYNDYLFRFLGASEVIAIRSREEANLPGIVAKIKNANTAMVYLGPGDQSKLIKEFVGTDAYYAIHKRYLADPHFTVMGNSAGTMAMPGGNDIMIDNWNGDKTGAILAKGLGFLQHIIIDTHVRDKRRLPRLPRMQDAVKQLVKRGEDVIGLGLDEGTALLFNNGRAEVLGKQMVWKITANELDVPPHELENKIPRFTANTLLSSNSSLGKYIELGGYASLTVPESFLREASTPAAMMRR